MRAILTLVIFTFANTIFSQSATENLTKVIADYEQFYKTKNELEIWPELAEGAFLQEKNFLKRQLVLLNGLDAENLSETDLINLDLLQFIVADKVFNLEFESHLFPLNAEGGFITNIVYGVQSKYLKDDEAFDDYVRQLMQLPAYFKKRIAWMLKGIAKNKMSPQLVVENCIQVLDDFLTQDPKESFYMNPVKGNDLRSAVVLDLLNDRIFPSYKQLKQFLQKQYLPKAPKAIAISGIENGRAFYEQRTKYYTTEDITPKEVFEVGQREVKRIRGEMEEIIKEVQFDGDFEAFIDFLRTDPQFYATDGKALLKEAAWITKRMEGQLPKLIGKLPRVPLTVTPVPAAIAENYTAGRYFSRFL